MIITNFIYKNPDIRANSLILIKNYVTMVNSADFAKRLGEILDFYGISAAAFSEMIAVNRSTISHLLSGRNKPSLEFVLKVLDVFPEVELYWLLNGQGHFPAPPKNQPTITPVVNSIANDSESSHTKQQQTQVNQNSSMNQKKGEDFGPIERIVVFYQNGKFKTYTP